MTRTRIGSRVAVAAVAMALPVAWGLQPATAGAPQTAGAPSTQAVGVTDSMRLAGASLATKLEAVDATAWSTGNGASTKRLVQRTTTPAASDSGASSVVTAPAVTSAIVARATTVRSTIADAGFQLSGYTSTSTQQVVTYGSGAALEVTVARSWTEVGQGETTPVQITDVYRVPLASGTRAGTFAASSLAFASEAEGSADDGGADPGAKPLPAASQAKRPTVSAPEDPAAPSGASTPQALAAASYIYNFRYADFAAYGKKWTGSPYDGDHESDFNSAYPYFDDNCANFVSQMWNNAGWSRTGGVNPYDGDNWDDNLTGPAGPSRTWSQAKSLYTYADDKKHLYHLGNIWNAVPGNTYFMDWDGNHVINHVTAVTGRTANGIPRISQKTNNRHNLLLTTWKSLVDHDNPHVLWYGLRRTASQ